MSSTPPIQPTLQQAPKPDLRSLQYAHFLEISKAINCARPGIIKSFNAENQTVTVQIAQQKVAAVSPDGVRTLQSFTECVTVPVFYPSGGGFTLTFPIAAGDECILIFSDRELDNWLLAGGSNTAPTTPRLHDLSDAFALVGVRSFPRSLSGVSTGSTQLRSDDGGTYVEIAGGGVVNVVAPTSINLTAPTVNINASTAVNVTTPRETVTGVLDIQNIDSASSPCTVNGNIVTNGDVVASGVSLVSHVHSGVQSGGSNTGQPV